VRRRWARHDLWMVGAIAPGARFAPPRPLPPPGAYSRPSRGRASRSLEDKTGSCRTRHEVPVRAGRTPRGTLPCTREGLAIRAAVPDGRVVKTSSGWSATVPKCDSAAPPNDGVGGWSLHKEARGSLNLARARHDSPSCGIGTSSCVSMLLPVGIDRSEPPIAAVKPGSRWYVGVRGNPVSAARWLAAARDRENPMSGSGTTRRYPW
jgi:hypothetical protein